MPEKHENLKFILDYAPAFQETFKAFSAQKQFYEIVAEKQKIPILGVNTSTGVKSFTRGQFTRGQIFC